MSSEEIIRKLIERDGNRCSICGQDNSPITVDHRINPIYLGGNETMENYRLICSRCNTLKNPNILGLEFVHYLTQLMRLNKDFRNASEQGVLKTSRLIVAQYVGDIIAEELIDGKWTPIYVECKAYSTFARSRVQILLENGQKN